MKARPRSVERNTAEYLSGVFAEFRLDPVLRQPILGRTGPDITLNQLNLVIDVKSRLAVPQTIFFPILIPFCFGAMVAFRLKTMGFLLAGSVPSVAPIEFHSKLIDDYWEHMDEWRREELPEGISMIILHRPKLPIGDAVCVIHHSEYERFIQLCQTLRS